MTKVPKPGVTTKAPVSKEQVDALSKPATTTELPNNGVQAQDGGMQESTMGVKLYHIFDGEDAGLERELVSVFKPTDPALLEALDCGTVAMRTYESVHQIKHNVKDKELEAQAVALFTGEVNARKQLAQRGFRYPEWYED